MPVSVHELTEAEYCEWDRFVYERPDATFFHLSGWKTVLNNAFGFRTHFLYAKQNNIITAVLPLAQVKSLLFGNNLVSLPFCVYGGILAADAESATQLQRAACNLADELCVDSLELRHIAQRSSDWPVKRLYVTFRKSIDPDPELLLKSIPNRQRAMVRKGIAEELLGEQDDGIERLYRVYAESVRNLGTPVFGANYLKVLREVFGEDCKVLMITKGGIDVAGVMSFYFRDEVLPYYGGSIAEARQIRGCNHFMYWELMRRSVKDGIRRFDFGRSKEGTGPYSFKKNFGFEATPLHYEYYLCKADDIPQVNPTNPKYRYLIKTWKRLPLSIANSIGPNLAKYLG